MFKPFTHLEVTAEEAAHMPGLNLIMEVDGDRKGGGGNIILSEELLQTLGVPCYVQMLQNREKRMMALRASAKKGPYASYISPDEAGIWKTRADFIVKCIWKGSGDSSFAIAYDGQKATRENEQVVLFHYDHYASLKNAAEADRR